ncbi:SusC/RagA family TonB-linked outer membrane protein [Chitinophaga niabensis]|uniref:TonB-linked outer membrane protein, SusC/RagA family n=1 Tax=Chitinophaga niabensis TaxID=536979 RepID=A0A1N6K1Z7_9BACT|nr:TonB-dependent receptor [Chitinophaga niabensis]SIO50608.1 TonB-linked outer membrane protein, SusC/RagA family [Chitinophaga niabensis]
MNLRAIKFVKAVRSLLPLLLLLHTAGVFAQTRITVTGKITASGSPLPYVSVSIQGTSQGATTNEQGIFTLNAQIGQTLIISHMGFGRKEVKITNQEPLNITLESTAQDILNDVVVVGYGTKKKTSVTAAISTLKGAEVASLPISNLSNGLGGRVAGVVVKQGSGEPGKDGSSIFIRGIASTGATQPLIIVDGIPRSFQQLDPNSIETFSILKDAAAVAPYGVAGANGVILVTTKKGKTGIPTLTYNGYVGFQNPVKLPDYVNSYQYATLRNAAAVNEGLPKPYSDADLQKFQDGSDPDAYPTFKNIWKDLTNRNAKLTNHNVEISGGTENVKYYAALGYQFQEGMWPATNTRRFNMTLNLDAKVTSTTNVSFNLNGRYQKDQYPSIGTGRIFELIGYLHPLYGPLKFSNGMYGTFVTGSLFNSGYQKINTTAIYSQISVEQQLPFLPGLKAKGTIAFDPTYAMNKTWAKPVQRASLDKSQTPYVIKDGIFGPTKASLSQSYANDYQLTYQFGLNYDRSFGKHGLSLLGLFEAKSNDYLSLGASRRNYNLSIDEISLGSASQADMSTSGTSSAARQMGLVYRIAYDYNRKYLLEASGRYDGSYYFSPDNRFGFFPAFSVGWRLSEEHFIKDNYNWINNLKIRASYGEVGALAGSPFQFMSTYSVLGTNYVLGGNAVQGIRERAEPNPNITWERAKKTDVGLEVNLWKGLLNVEADYFYEKRSNMLVNPDVIVPAEYGIGLSQVNAGVMENRGFDLSVSSVYDVSKDLHLSLGANLTYAKNKVLQVFESATTYNNPNRRITGKPLGTQFGFHALGYFQQSDFDGSGALKSGIATQPWGAVKPGDIRYEDINKDGKINDADLTVIGDPNAAPRIIYGIAPGIKYKTISLDLLFQGAAKTNWYYHGSSIMPFWETMLPYVHNFDYWTPENPNAANPRLTSSPTVNNSQRSSFWMANAAYLRLKSATLSYNLPANVLSKIKMQNIRIYLSGQNIFTWTKLINYDPEIGRNDSGHPDSAWGYPNQKTLSVGANITF